MTRNSKVQTTSHCGSWLMPVLYSKLSDGLEKNLFAWMVKRSPYGSGEDSMTIGSSRELWRAFGGMLLLCLPSPC